MALNVLHHRGISWDRQVIHTEKPSFGAVKERRGQGYGRRTPLSEKVVDQELVQVANGFSPLPAATVSRIVIRHTSDPPVALCAPAAREAVLDATPFVVSKAAQQEKSQSSAG